MSYKHDPYTDSFTHINDEGNITISLNCQNQQARIVKYAELSDETIDAIADAVAAKMQTTVDVPDKKIGKWLERQVFDGKVIEEWQTAKCSVCGKYHTTPYLYYFDCYKFCPNCGAQMEGKDGTVNR